MINFFLLLFQAYWIAHRACKYVFDDIDGLKEAPEPITYIWPAMRSYFNVTDRNSILPYLYANFDKSIIAGFAKEIAVGCERGDPLCLKLFEEAGQILAKHIVAVSKKAHNVSISTRNEIKQSNLCQTKFQNEKNFYKKIDQLTI